jgi:hypothetical protein
MPVLFKLVVNFGADEQAAQSATQETQRGDPIVVRGVPLPLNGPFVSRLGSPNPHTEWSVSVAGMGVHASGPKPDIDPGSLTSEEITHVGHALYDLLASFTGYRAAVVGWNPKSLVDIDRLETRWRKGEPPSEKGLVLAEDLCDRWGLGRQWVTFSAGYRWQPYAGSSNIRWSGWHAGRSPA